MDNLTRATDVATEAPLWGGLPERVRVLLITNSDRNGRWLAESFAADSAARVFLEEASGIVNGLARLRDDVFDAVLIAHDGQELNALEILDAVRAGSTLSQPVIVLGRASEPEMEAICFESGADAYLCLERTTVRSLIWAISRAAERHRLIVENARLRRTLQHERKADLTETERVLGQQRRLARPEPEGDRPDEPSEGTGEAWNPPRTLVDHYQELLQAYVIMGSGNLSRELAQLARIFGGAGIQARQFMRVHLMALDATVTNLGTRSSRHVLNRAAVLALEVLICLCEGYRQHIIESVQGGGQIAVADQPVVTARA
jgi:CheY-like chemotaxis protein